MKHGLYCSIIVLFLSLFLTSCDSLIEASKNDGSNRWGDRPVAPFEQDGTVLPSDEEANSDLSDPSYGSSEFRRAAESVLEGQSFTNLLGMRMIWINSGNFVMGREESSKRKRVPVNGTWPLRTVNVKNGFWIAQTEITQEQYKRLKDSNPSHFKGRYNPVDSVSWKESVQFCNLLTEHQNSFNIAELNTGKKLVYLLPSEAQWEYCCRAGSTGVFYGPELFPLAWFFPNSKQATHPVRSKKPNDWGLYDMLGNVEEWCSDKFAHTYIGAPLDESSRQNLSTVRRVIRGGSYSSRYVREISSSARKGAGPAYRYKRTGFRPVMVFQETTSNL